MCAKEVLQRGSNAEVFTLWKMVCGRAHIVLFSPQVVLVKGKKPCSKAFGVSVMSGLCEQEVHELAFSLSLCMNCANNHSYHAYWGSI